MDNIWKLRLLTIKWSEWSVYLGYLLLKPQFILHIREESAAYAQTCRSAYMMCLDQTNG